MPCKAEFSTCLSDIIDPHRHYRANFNSVTKLREFLSVERKKRKKERAQDSG
ncbi:hypothetical protein SK128_000075, partial [Halocaridina rubra]